MRIITDSNAIREAIRWLLGDQRGERIVAVAFVGADALSFLRNPKGLKVFCWPQAGGTNPEGIDDLVAAGAEVSFVRGLHAKIYWSIKRGTIIGSANLTANALNEKGLREAVIQLPPHVRYPAVHQVPEGRSRFWRGTAGIKGEARAVSDAKPTSTAAAGDPPKIALVS